MDTIRERRNLAKKLNQYFSGEAKRGSKKAFASAVGISQQTLSNWLSGRTLISENHLEKVRKVLDRSSTDTVKRKNGKLAPTGRGRIKRVGNVSFPTESEHRALKMLKLFDVVSAFEQQRLTGKIGAVKYKRIVSKFDAALNKARKLFRVSD